MERKDNCFEKSNCLGCNLTQSFLTDRKVDVQSDVSRGKPVVFSSQSLEDSSPLH